MQAILSKVVGFLIILGLTFWSGMLYEKQLAAKQKTQAVVVEHNEIIKDVQKDVKTAAKAASGVVNKVAAEQKRGEASVKKLHEVMEEAKKNEASPYVSGDALIDPAVVRVLNDAVAPTGASAP